MATAASPYAAFRKGKPIMADFDAGSSTYKAGDVLVKGAIPVVFHEDVPAFTGGPTRDAIAVGGGIYECMTDGSGVVGQDVFWDATNKKITATQAGNTHFGKMVAGPTFLSSDASPAADGDLCWVLHDPRGVSPCVDSEGNSEATQSTTAALSVAQVLGGFVNSAPAAGITLTSPTAAALVAGVPGCKVGDTIDLMIENTSGGANAITLAAGTGVTMRGGTSIAQNKSALIRFVLTNVTVSSEAVTMYNLIGA